MNEFDKKLTKIVNNELAEKSKSVGEMFREIYENLPSDIHLLLKFDVFDNQRKDEYLQLFSRIQKIKDPQQRMEALSRLYLNVKNSLLYALGAKDPEFIRISKKLKPEEKIEKAIEFGARYFYY